MVWLDQKTIDKINRDFARECRAHAEFNAYIEKSAKRKGPMPARSMRKYSRLQLASLREAGIQFVQLLGSNCAAIERDACRAIKAKIIPIENAPLLPLAECNQKFCRCLWLARKDLNPTA
jgi:hypothetical protein